MAATARPIGLTRAAITVPKAGNPAVSPAINVLPPAIAPNIAPRPVISPPIAETIGAMTVNNGPTTAARPATATIVLCI